MSGTCVGSGAPTTLSVPSSASSSMSGARSCGAEMVSKMKSRLARRPRGTWFDGSDYEPKLSTIASAQAAGRIRPGDPSTLLMLIISMASTWSAASEVYTATPDEPEAVHDTRRTLLRESVTRLLAP
jgi:hypothetical protein